MEKKRVLLIDDEPAFVRLLKLSLDQTGRYDVRVECSGSTGLAAARAFHPDVILLDVVMPDVDGRMVARQLAADPGTTRIPVVFLTAAISREQVKAAQDPMLGGRPVMAKPVSSREVMECLERHLGAPL
jgi:CheY-like chemotaxis protein